MLHYGMQQILLHMPKYNLRGLDSTVKVANITLRILLFLFQGNHSTDTFWYASFEVVLVCMINCFNIL